MQYAFSNVVSAAHTAGKVVCRGEYIFSAINNRIKVFLAQAKTSYTLPCETRYSIEHFAVTDDAKFIFTVDRRNKGMLISVDTGVSICRMAFTSDVHALAFSHDRSLLAVATATQLQVWQTPINSLLSLQTATSLLGSIMFHLSVAIPSSDVTKVVAVSPDNTFLLAGGTNSTVTIYMIRDFETRETSAFRSNLPYRQCVLSGNKDEIVGIHLDPIAASADDLVGTDELYRYAALLDKYSGREALEDADNGASTSANSDASSDAHGDANSALKDLAETVDADASFSKIVALAAAGKLGAFNIITVSRDGCVFVWAPGYPENLAGGESGWFWHCDEQRFVQRDTHMLLDDQNSSASEGDGESGPGHDQTAGGSGHEGSDEELTEERRCAQIQRGILARTQEARAEQAKPPRDLARHMSTVVTSSCYNAATQMFALGFADGHYNLYAYDRAQFLYALEARGAQGRVLDLALENLRARSNVGLVSHFRHVHNLSVSHYPLTSIALCDAGSYVALASTYDKALIVWDWASEAYVVRESNAGVEATACAASPDDAFYAVGYVNGSVSVFDAASSFVYATFEGSGGSVTDLAFSPTSRVLAAAGSDGVVTAFDLNKRVVFRRLAPSTAVVADDVQTPAASVRRRKTRAFSCICFDSSGEILAAGCADGEFEVYLFQLQTGRLLEELRGHEGPVTSLQFSPAGTGQLCSAGWDATIRVWDTYAAAIPCEVLQEASEVHQVRFARDGKQLIGALANGNLSVWDVEAGRQLAYIRVARDIAGGYNADEHRHHLTSTYGKSIKTFDTSGDLLVGGGDSRYIVVYSGGTLVRKLQITIDKGVHGVRKQLLVDRRGRVLDVSSDSDLDDADLEAQRMARLTAEKSRQTRRVVDSVADLSVKVQARVARVALTASGERFIALTPVGILEYSKRPTPFNRFFDPLELAYDVTIEGCRQCLAERRFGAALAMALALQEPFLFEEFMAAYELFLAAGTAGAAGAAGDAEGADETSSMKAVATALNRKYWARFMDALARHMEQCAGVEFGLRLAQTFVYYNAAPLEAMRAHALPGYAERAPKGAAAKGPGGGAAGDVQQAARRLQQAIARRTAPVLAIMRECKGLSDAIVALSTRRRGCGEEVEAVKQNEALKVVRALRERAQDDEEHETALRKKKRRYNF